MRAFYLLALAVVGLCPTPVVYTQVQDMPLYVSVAGPTKSPIGWVEFCVRYTPECDTQPSTPRDVTLTEKAQHELTVVNDWVNKSIQQVTDMEHWGVDEQWDYPSDGKGDCEDFALLKRKMLIRAGWPREALLMTVVRDENDDGHAVLTVKTTQGELILDSKRPEIVLWYQTGYRFVKRQSQADQNVWVSLSGNAQTIASTRSH